MPRKLKEIEADEVSLVDKAANKTKFFILKRSKLMDEFIKILKQWFGEDVLTDEEIAKAKELPTETVEAATSALESLSEHKDVYPDDYLDALNMIIKGALIERKITVTDETEFDIEKLTEEQFSKATLKQLKKLKEIVDGLLKAKEETTKSKDGEKLSDEVVAKLEELDEYKRKEKEAAEKTAADEKKKEQEEIQKLKDDIEELKKKRGVKKGIEGQEGGKEDDDEDTPKWTSLTKGQAEA